MRILVLGADGYLGWPTCMNLSNNGHEVIALDNFCKRKIELEGGIEPLIHCPSLHTRVKEWKNLTGKTIHLRVGDLLNHRFIYQTLNEFKPEAIVHYAEQPSAPYSMKGRQEAAFTLNNNVIGNLNLLFAMRAECPEAHLVKLGTMGEYGTPNIDIEEGYLDIEHNGRKATIPYPKKPGSFYHLSKVHDSNNIIFACRIWGLRVTDLNQGAVYGIDTDETLINDSLRTSFHYDHIFGTVLNRFCVQAVAGYPLTVYGKGGQTRGFLNIKDTLKCVSLAVNNPVKNGECRIMNQFTETFSVNELANKVKESAKEIGIDVKIDNINNPRIEDEEHYYNAKNTKLADLGLKPDLLNNNVIISMLKKIIVNKKQIQIDTIKPNITWKN